MGYEQQGGGSGDGITIQRLPVGAPLLVPAPLPRRVLSVVPHMAVGRDGAVGAPSGWLQRETAEILSSLDDDHRLIGACCGRANPFLLEWVAGNLGVGAAHTVLDLGAGIGGPAVWLSRRTGARFVGVDAAEDAVAGLRRLFPFLPAVVGRIEALPMADASVDAVIALGVLDQVPRLGEVARSVARVLRPGGRFVALFHVSDHPSASGPPRPAARPGGADGIPPAANHFRPASAHLHPFHEAGFDRVHLESFPSLPDSPDLWRRVRASVTQALRDRHGADLRHRAAERQRQRFEALENAAAISLRGLTATRTA